MMISPAKGQKSLDMLHSTARRERDSMKFTHTSRGITETLAKVSLKNGKFALFFLYWHISQSSLG